MRLRLSVQRHSLPPTNVLWSVPETSSPVAYTIARLLEDVNHIVPLEAEHWGLEDYVVEVQGFECLHFSPVSQALKEDDLVSIRPLLTAEVRARTLTGRAQINDGGQHLIDGIPFGRPYLRKPYRPAVRIPPRKRQRLNEDTEAGVDELNTIRLITANSETSYQGSILSNGVTSPVQQVTPRRSNSKTVQFKKPIIEQVEDSSSDSEDDEDFAPDAESLGSDVSMSEDSDSDSADSPDSDASSSDSDSGSSSGSTGSSNASSGPEVHKIQHPKPKTNGVPGMGLKVTRSRNHRRRDGAQLRKLKILGILHTDASLEDFRAWNGEDAATKEQRIAEAKERAAIEGENVSGPARKRKRGAVAATNETPTFDGLTELEQRKRELMTQMGEDDAPASDLVPAKPTPTPTTESVSTHAEYTPSTTELPPTPAPAEPARKRLRPDTSAISRILARQTQPLVKKSGKSQAVERVPEPEPVDPKLWRSKINLSAFECWEEDFELSAPPFPFKQHWDEASNLIRQKVNEQQKKKKKRKNSPREPWAVEEQAETIVLDYGDAPDAEMKQVNQDIEAIESQLRQDVEVAAQSDLPPVPEDVNSLPALTRDDVKVGAIIVFKVFEMSGGAPEINVKTAIIESEGDSGNGGGIIGVRLAERDREKVEHKYDKKGDRVYEKADNFRLHNGEEEDDDGWRDFDFNELMDAKLLQAAANAA